MTDGRHVAGPVRGPVHRVANALCTAVVVVGVGTVLLADRASGYADPAAPAASAFAVGRAVVPDGLAPGDVLTGRLPVSNPGPAAVQVTQVVFDLPVADAGHPACRPGSVVLTATDLPVLAGGTGRAIPFAVTMSAAAGNACQGATFTSHYRVTARAV